MNDHNLFFDLSEKKQLSPELKDFFNKTRDDLKGYKRRVFMARVVSLLGRGGQLRAEQELGWGRGAIRK